MSGIDRRMFILTNANANKNKFWEITMDASGQVSTRNGRVGTAGQERVLGAGEALFQRKIREKTRKGYRQVDIVGAVADEKKVDTAQVASAAEEQIARGNPVIAELVRELAKINRHQIIAASGGQMDVDLTTGVVSTPLGVVTAQNISKARRLLMGFEPFIAQQDFDNPGFVQPLEEYLMLVPQKVGSRRGWHRDFLTEMGNLTEQDRLLDQLEASIEIAEARVRDAAAAKSGKPKVEEKIFDVQMAPNEDPDLRRRVETLYRRGRQDIHSSRHLKPARIFDVSLGSMDRSYEEDGAKVGGVMELWHGTRAHNLLSILKSGLIIPRSSGSIHITGRMFGNGIYFSDQSTKSLNYAYGYWDGGARDDRCYMFLADVAMGTPWHPTQTGSRVRPPRAMTQSSPVAARIMS